MKKRESVGGKTAIEGKRGFGTAAIGLLLLLGACRRAPQSVKIDSSPPTVPESAPGSSSAAAPAGLGADLTDAERDAVSHFLKSHPDLRMAADDDARSSDESEDVARLYGVYHPYFVRGDVNDDGRIDFVTAFVSRKIPSSSPWFTVAVFRGTPKGDFAEPVLLEREISLQDGDLSIDRDSIVITPDISSDANRRYRWNTARGRFDFVSDAGSGDSNEPTRRI